MAKATKERNLRLFISSIVSNPVFPLYALQCKHLQRRSLLPPSGHTHHTHPWCALSLWFFFFACLCRIFCVAVCANLGPCATQAQECVISHYGQINCFSSPIPFAHKFRFCFGHRPDQRRMYLICDAHSSYLMALYDDGLLPEPEQHKRTKKKMKQIALISRVAWNVTPHVCAHTRNSRLRANVVQWADTKHK